MPIHDAPDFRVATNIIQGDVTISAFDNIARLTGLTALSSGVLSSAPAGTFIANLYTTEGEIRAFPATEIAGTGITYTTSVANGPSPEVVFENVYVFGSPGTLSYTVPIPDEVLEGDRVVLATYHNNAGQTLATPAGFTLMSTITLGAGLVKLFERIWDGATDPSDIPLVAGTTTSHFAYLWQIRYSDPAVPLEFVSNLANNTSDTSNDLPNLTQSWGQSNTLYLVFIGIENDVTDPNISAFPGGLERSSQTQLVSGTAALDGGIGWGWVRNQVSSVNFTAFTYGPARSGAFGIAIPPRESGRFDWDGVPVRKNSTGGVSTRRRLNFIEGSNVTITVTDDAVDDEVDITIASSGGGGSAHVIQDNGTSRTARANLNFDSTTSIIAAVTDDAGNNQSDVTMQRAALTGAITASQNSNTTAFGALAAKSVLANATNASAVPAALAGSAAFQHLRVNSANNALEWAVLTVAAPITLTSDTIGFDQTATLDNNARVGVRKNSAGSTFTRRRVNLIEGSGVTLTVADDSPNEEVDVTITASATGLSAIADRTALGNDSGASAIPTAVTVHQELDWIGGSKVWTFDGVDDRISMGNVLSFERTTPFSIAFWFATTAAGPFQILSKILNTSTNRGWQAFMSAGRIFFQIINDAATLNLIQKGTTGAFNDGALHSCVITYSGSALNTGITIYIDNVVVANSVSGATISATSLSAGNLAISGIDGSATQVFGPGILSNCSVWNQLLNATQAGEIVANGPRTNLTSTTVAANLLGWWKLDEDDTTGASGVLDYGTGSNEGTAAGSLAPTDPIGHLAVRSGANWQLVPPGTTGLALVSNGYGVLPTYKRTGFIEEQIDAGTGTVDVTLLDTTTRLTLSAATGTLRSISGGSEVGRTLIVYFVSTTANWTITHSTGSPPGGDNSTRIFLENNADQIVGPRASLMLIGQGSSGWRAYFRPVVSPSGLAPQATDTLLANITAGTAAPTAVAFTTIDSTSLPWDATSHTLRRAALTGAVTAAIDSNTTAFGTLAAKSVLANATNATAVPAALAGSAAFQHLRVNSANTALEWSVLTTGDFPNNSVPITGLATVAAKTVLANATNTTATPTAFASSAANQYLRVNSANTALEWATITGGGAPTWAQVLANGATSGATSPLIASGQALLFDGGTAAGDIQVTAAFKLVTFGGNIAFSTTFAGADITANTVGGIALQAGATPITSVAASDIIMAADADVRIGAASGVNITAGSASAGAADTGDIAINASAQIVMLAGITAVTGSTTGIRLHTNADVTILAEDGATLEAGFTSATSPSTGDVLINAADGIRICQSATQATAAGGVHISSDDDILVRATGGGIGMDAGFPTQLNPGVGDILLNGTSGIRLHQGSAQATTATGIEISGDSYELIPSNNLSAFATVTGVTTFLTLATLTIPANTITAGMSWKYAVHAQWQRGLVTTASNIIYRIVVDGTVQKTVNRASATAASSAGNIDIFGEIVWYTTGATSTFGGGGLNIDTITTTQQIEPHTLSSSLGGPYDTTSSIVILIEAQTVTAVSNLAIQAFSGSIIRQS